MRTAILGLGAAALVAVAALGFLLFETTTVSSTILSGSGTRSSCGPDPWDWMNGGRTRGPDASYTREVRNGEIFDVTLPAGPYEMRIHGSGTSVDPAVVWGQPRAPPGACTAEPTLQRYIAEGDGTITVEYWLFE